MKNILLLLFAFYCGLAATNAAAEDNTHPGDTAKTTVAVMDLRPLSGISPQDVQAFSDRLRGELVTTGAFTVLERAMMKEILQEQAFQQSDVCDEQSCIAQVGQLLAVHKMIGGSVGKVGNLYSVNVKIVDVKTGIVERQITRNVKSSKGDLVRFHAKNIAREFAGLAPVKKSIIGPVLFIAGPVVLGGAVAAILVVYGGKGSGSSGDPVKEIVIEGTIK